MANHQIIKQLSEKIRQYFDKGILPETDVRHYIDSTFSYPTRKELEAILHERGNCERETLLELIFFPGQAVQIDLEDLITSGRFHKKAEEEIIQDLMQKRPSAALFYPDKDAVVRFKVPEHAVRQFISRLTIHKRLTGSLLDVIGRTLNREKQLCARVMIRNARFPCRDAKAEFLESIFLTVDTRQETFFPLLDFVLHFLETAPSEISLKTSLAAQKQQYRKHLFKAEQFEKVRKDRNMETLIMQGVRIPHCDARDAMEKIVMLDTVSLAIYGQTL